MRLRTVLLLVALGLAGILSAMVARRIAWRVLGRRGAPVRTVRAAAPLPADLPVVFRFAGAPEEVRSLSNDAPVRPSLAPPGLAGKVVVRGAGWIRRSAPGGLQFGPGGQQARDSAFLQFSGRGAGALFDVSSPGSVSFRLRSALSFSRRLAAAADGSRQLRTVMEAWDDGVRQFTVGLMPHDGLLTVVYGVGTSPAFFYFVPKGKEDQWFGEGVSMDIRVAWDGAGVAQLSVNGDLVDSRQYSRAKPVWTDKASFSIGARDQHEYGGGFFACGDAIGDVVVASAGQSRDVKPPQVRTLAPLAGAPVAGTTLLEASASDDDVVAAVRFLVDGSPVGEVKSYPYRLFWDSRSVRPGAHELVVEAVDPAGNAGRESRAFNVAPPPSPDTEAPAPVGRLYTLQRRPGEIQIGWMPSADNVATAVYRVYRDGAVAASVPAPPDRKAQQVVYTDRQVRPAENHVYQVQAVDAAGNAAPLGAPLTLAAPPSAGATLRVGPGAKYARPCDAIRAAVPGDTIEIDAAGNGTYDGDVCYWKTDDLTIRGVNGRPRIDAQGRNAESKGVWVIAGRRNVVENVEISGAVCPDQNGAAIRLEGPDAVIRNVYFHHNQNGILSGSVGGRLLIEFSEFAYNGDGSGQSHNLYVNVVDHLIFRFNYSHHARIGHLLKTRALRSDILYNRLSDEEGSASYELDFPYGGLIHVIGNVVQQSKTTDNAIFISNGIEGLPAGRPQALFLVNNTFVNERQTGEFMRTARVPVAVWNNLIVGNTGFVLPDGARSGGNVRVAGDPGFVNMAARDYRLAAATPAVSGVAVPPESRNSPAGVRSAPEFVYVHPAGGAAIQEAAARNSGAYPVAPQ